MAALNITRLVDNFINGAPNNRPRAVAKVPRRRTIQARPATTGTSKIPRPDISGITSWIEIPREYRLDPIAEYVNVTNVNSTMNRVKAPKNFTITLLPHQELTVSAMIDLERKRTMSFWKLDNAGQFVQGRMETSAGVLREELGSGKTYEILALIMLNPDVRKVKEIGGLPTSESWHRRDQELRHRERFSYTHGRTETRLMYSKFYSSTLIFVAKSVINQWYEAITEHTNLRTFVIADVRAMHEFYNMAFHPELCKEEIHDYDIILVKNGDISGKFDKPELVGTILEGVKKKPIITVFSELFRDSMWKRIVLDDFDTLGVPSNAKIIPSLFTWFVSATKKNVTTEPKKREYWYDLEEILDNYRPTYLDVRYNAELFTFGSIANSPEDSRRSAGASIINFHVFKFINPNEQVVGALNAMATEDAVNFAEMLNADAIHTAAKKANIKSNNPVDVFKKVLDDKWDSYIHSGKVIAYADEVSTYILSLPLPDEDNKSNKISNGGLEDVRKNVEVPGPKSAFVKVVKLQEEATSRKVQEVKTNASRAREIASKAIDRVKNNLREGTCPITCIPLSEAAGVVIMNCCGMTMSVEAAQMGMSLKKNDRGDIKGVCANCRAVVTHKNIVLIDRTMGIDNLISHEISDEPAVTTTKQPVKVPDVTPTAKPADATKEVPNAKVDDATLAKRKRTGASAPDDMETKDKYNCLAAILSRSLAEVKELYANQVTTGIDIQLQGLMQGEFDKGEAPIDDKKALIFANFAETLDIIRDKLDACGISFSMLHGTHEQIRTMVKMYNLPNEHPNSIKVLLINGAKYAAGLNLQATTDLIYVHVVADSAIESQIAGRAARIGRKHNLNIHYIGYENEIRVLRDKQAKRAATQAAKKEEDRRARELEVPVPVTPKAEDIEEDDIDE